MASHVTTVYLVGATGKTGSIIVDGLLERSDEFVSWPLPARKFTLYNINCIDLLQKVIAAIRPASADKPSVATLRERGVGVHIIDLASSSYSQLVDELRGVDAVVCTLSPTEFYLQKPLARAAKQAGVTRFVLSDFATACVRGVMRLHDMVRADLGPKSACGRISDRTRTNRN